MTDSTLPSPNQWCVHRRHLLIFSLLIFLSGLLLGSGGTLIFMRYRFVHIMRNPRQLHENLADHMSHDLALSPEQRDQIRQIVQTRMENMQRLRSQTRPLMDEQYQKMQSEIKALLSPEQATKWERQFGRESLGRRQPWFMNPNQPPEPPGHGRQGDFPPPPPPPE
jgi:hypothetical protein